MLPHLCVSGSLVFGNLACLCCIWLFAKFPGFSFPPAFPVYSSNFDVFFTFPAAFQKCLFLFSADSGFSVDSMSRVLVVFLVLRLYWPASRKARVFLPVIHIVVTVVPSAYLPVSRLVDLFQFEPTFYPTSFTPCKFFPLGRRSVSVFEFPCHVHIL